MNCVNNRATDIMCAKRPRKSCCGIRKSNNTSWANKKAKRENCTEFYWNFSKITAIGRKWPTSNNSRRQVVMAVEIGMETGAD